MGRQEIHGFLLLPATRKMKRQAAPQKSQQVGVALIIIIMVTEQLCPYKE
jgi:hypothetical protein